MGAVFVIPRIIVIRTRLLIKLIIEGLLITMKVFMDNIYYDNQTINVPAGDTWALPRYVQSWSDHFKAKCLSRSFALNIK